MFRKRLIIVIIFTLLFAASFIAAYFALSNAASQKIQSQGKDNVNIKNAVAETVSSPKKSDLVTDKTKVIIIYSYLPDSNYDVIQKNVEDDSHINSIVGMNEEQVKKYFENMNYKLGSFSAKEIKIFADTINSWPPNSFVVKTNVDEIVVYTVDSQGILTLPSKTGIYLDMLPTEDQDSVKKGKVYYKYEDVEELLDDYRS